ncbi:glycoside hydrolase family protein [Chryseobacterium phage MA9V-1]|nr:glycoside hydrolase family protein [Chryseobacterium phage MA9V-1]
MAEEFKRVLPSELGTATEKVNAKIIVAEGDDLKVLGQADMLADINSKVAGVDIKTDNADAKATSADNKATQAKATADNAKTAADANTVAVKSLNDWAPKQIKSDTTVNVNFTANVNDGYINDVGVAVPQLPTVNNRYTNFIPVKAGDIISGVSYISTTPNAISFYTAANENSYVIGVKGTGASQSSPASYNFLVPQDGFVRFCSSTLGAGSYNIRTIVYDGLAPLNNFVKEVMYVSDPNLVDSKKLKDIQMNGTTKLIESYRGGFMQFCRLRLGEKCFYKSSHSAFFLKDTGEKVDMPIVNGQYFGEYVPDASGNFYTANRFNGLAYLKKQEYEILKGKRIVKGGSIVDDPKCNVIKFLYIPGMDVLNIKTKRPVEYPFIVRQGQTWGFEDNFTSEEVSFFFAYTARATIYVNCFDMSAFEFNRLTVPREIKATNNADCMLVGNELYSYNFGDEFAGTTLDLNKWKYRTGEKSNGNNVKEAITFGNGNLKIRVWANTPGDTTFIQDEDGNNTSTPTTKGFNGGGIISIVPGIQYGYFEASIKMPSSYYMHSSFWTTQSFLNSGESSLTKNEIDIVEFDMKSNTVATGFNMLSAIHRWTPTHVSLGYGAKVDYFNTTMNDYTQNFNKFGCLVTEDFIAMYFNGVLVNTITYKELVGFTVNPCEIILSCLPYTTPDLLGKTEDFMEVEYVRYYKK